MRVLWFSHLVPYPPRTGALLRAYYLLRSVAAHHEVDLVTFVQEPLLATFYPTLQEGLEDCRRNLNAICGSVTFVPIAKLQRPLGKALTAAESLLSKDCYMARWLSSAQALRVLSDLTREHQYDIAHFDHESLANYRPALGAVPVTLGHHNAESHMLIRRAENERTLWRKLYFRHEGKRLAAFERRIAGAFVTHITCSELDSARLRDVMPHASFRTIPNGVDIDFFSPAGTPEQRESLIFVASMNWYPNVDAVLFLLRDVWPRIKARVPNATLDIIGSGAPKSVTGLAATLRDVRIRGYVQEIRPSLDSASLYVCTVRDGGGTKLKVLDAFAMSKCVVAHPVSCEGINVTPGKDVVFANTADEFAHEVSRLLADPAERARIGNAARKLVVAEYSFAAIGGGLTRLLEQLADAHAPQPDAARHDAA